MLDQEIYHPQQAHLSISFNLDNHWICYFFTSMASRNDIRTPILKIDNEQRRNQVHKDKDLEYLQRAQWLRAAALGADDRLVSATSLMMGVGLLKRTSKPWFLLVFRINWRCLTSSFQSVFACSQKGIKSYWNVIVNEVGFMLSRWMNAIRVQLCIYIFLIYSNSLISSTCKNLVTS